MRAMLLLWGIPAGVSPVPQPQPVEGARDTSAVSQYVNACFAHLMLFTTYREAFF